MRKIRNYRGKGRHRREVLLGCGLLLLAIVIACGSYLGKHYPADAAALAALESDGKIVVHHDGNLTVFAPESGAEQGFVFYPGGKVEHTAYAPLLRKLAEEGTHCILVEMPFHLAVLDADAAKGIPEQWPEISEWYIGGHSLGGSMAAAYAADHGDAYEGLVLLASYSTADLSETDLRVLSVYGSEDGVLNFENYGSYRSNLPGALTEAVLDGGNHACFGSYGPQKGDGTARISGTQQVEMTAELLTDFMNASH